MTSADDDDLLAALQRAAVQETGMSNDEMLALMNREADPNPLDAVDWQGEHATNEEAAEAEMSVALEGFQARARREQERFELVTETTYWFALCFRSEAQKWAFLEAKGWAFKAGGLGKYVNGLEVARIEGIELPEADLPSRRPFKHPAGLEDMVGGEDMVE